MVSRHGGLRARDSDRVDACALLDNARATGELTEVEHARRTALAMTARTFADLDALIGDLQIPRNLANAPLIRTERRNRAQRWIMAGAAVTVAALIGAFFGWVTETDTERAGGPNLTTGQGIGGYLAVYQDEYGAAPVDEVSFYPEHVRVVRPVAGDGKTAEDLYYRDSRFKVSTTSPRSSGKESFPLTGIDLPKIAAILAGAPQTLNIPDGKISHISLGRASGSADTDPVFTVYVGDGGNNGNLTVSITGEPREISPFAGK